jgi:four helix bundle protein
MTVKKKYLKDIQDLIVYRKSLIYRKRIYSILESIPSSNEFMKADIRKASCALCSNLAEGNGNYYYEREYQHYDIALCMLAKSQSLLDLLFGLGYVSEQLYENLQDCGSEIRRIIIRLMEEIEELSISVNDSNVTNPFRQSQTIIKEDTTILQEVRQFQRRIGNMVKKLPYEIEQDNVIDQIVRSSNSIYENLLRTEDLSSQGKILYYLSVTIASAVETKSWLDISRMENYITKMEYQSLNNEVRKIQMKLTQMINQINKQFPNK